MKIFKIHKKESNLNENVQKERVKLTKKKLPMLNNTNDSESCFRALSTAKSRRMTDKKTYDIRSLSLNQNFLHLKIIRYLDLDRQKFHLDLFLLPLSVYQIPLHPSMYYLRNN